MYNDNSLDAAILLFGVRTILLVTLRVTMFVEYIVHQVYTS